MSEDWEAEARADWESLSGAARDTLICLCKHGPTHDGNVPSKQGRDELLRRDMAAKIVLKNNEQGYQAATYSGSRAFRFGYMEPRKNVVRRLLGPLADWVKP